MFRFTIRDLLWLMVVVAVGTGWFAHWRAMNGEINALRTEYEEDLQNWLQTVNAQGRAINRLTKENVAINGNHATVEAVDQKAAAP